MAQIAGVDLMGVDDLPDDYGRWLVHGPQGSGKRLPLGTGILTETGWRAIETLRVGDTVIGVDGAPWPVYGISGIVERETYRVTLNDGGTVLADGDHLWEVTNRKGHAAVKTTEQIRDELARGGSATLPRMLAVRHPEADLPIDPYVLGALLADGHLHGRTVTWTKTNEDVRSQFLSRVPAEFAPVSEYLEGYTPRVRFRGTALRDALDALDLRVPSAEKFIPAEYFIASVDQRQALLAGLFDGDGRVSGKGQRLYHSTSKVLVKDVQELCWSLGIGANMHSKKSDGTWSLGLTTPYDPFWHHPARETVPVTGYVEARRVVSVEPVGLTEGLCIAVDSPRNLYVTEDYIVTHNTTLASTVAELGPTLFIDTTGEKGVRSFKSAPYADNITVVRPDSVTKMDDIFWALNKGEATDKNGKRFEAVVIDSLTGVQKMTMRYLLGHSETAVREIKQGTAPADIRTWGQSLDVMVDTATFWYGLADGNREHPMHVVMTAQTKIIEDEIADNITRTPDVQKGALSIVLASPDYIVYTEEEENLDALGDESLPQTRHIMRFGGHPGYRTKARVPFNLRGKIPSVIGRGKNPPSLASLSKVLGVGGVAGANRATDAK